MKKLLMLALLCSGTAMAQVSRRIVVEHFTNSRCSICASLNPGFYQNLAAQGPNVVHIAYHPSSPYQTCLFSQQNKVENDARTQFYGVYGSTPKFLINGTLITTSTNYNDPAIFNPFENLTSNWSLNMNQMRIGDSIEVRTVLKRISAGPETNLVVYGGLAEDTVFYSSPNGENRHYDVFRKALLGNSGQNIPAPVQVGDSLVWTSRVGISANWNTERLYSYAIVQQSGNRQVLQTQALPPGLGLTTTIHSLQKPSLRLFPNPALDQLRIELPSESVFEGAIWDTQGKLHQRLILSSSETVSLSGLAPGYYVLKGLFGGFPISMPVLKR
jgi:hypothetical protein